VISNHENFPLPHTVLYAVKTYTAAGGGGSDGCTGGCTGFDEVGGCGLG